MAEKRKLQAEIEKTLKRVEEGIIEFDNIFQKIVASTTSSHREKLEAELKREIKKLQRLRDQIKSWQTSPDVKDKQPLEEARKSIEREMERFKAIEKELKMKAFSKEGLAAARGKVDPHEKERERHRKWIREFQDQLTTKIDEFEAELESAGSKKKDSSASSRISALEQHVGRHRWHLDKLEHVLRRLENDEVDLEQLDDLKDFVEYFIECHEDPEFIFDQEIYSGFEREIVDEASGGDSFSLRRDSQDTSSSSAAAAGDETSKQPSPGEALAAAAAALRPLSQNGSAAQPSQTEPASPGAALPPSDKEPISETEFPLGETPPSRPLPAPLTPTRPPAAPAREALPAIPAPSTSPPVAPLPIPLVPVPLSPLPAPPSPPKNSPKSPPLPARARSPAPEETSMDLTETARALQASYAHLPTPLDSGMRPKYRPLCPWYGGGPHFPSQALPNFDTPEFFRRFEAETLFFVFYCQCGTYQQYLAASELKNEAWRFHSGLGCWFQRAAAPVESNTVGEKGCFVYFDYDQKWSTRMKADYTFDYAMLEDEVEISSKRLASGGLPL